MRRLAAVLALPVALVAARPYTPVAPRPHVIDKAHSQINFIADSRLISARGHFNTWDAEISLDPANLAGSTVAITIDAATIDTRVERRDAHLKSADFFDVEKHPKITFKSTAVRPKAEGALDIEGDLTIRGTTKRVTIPATMVFYDAGLGRFRGEFVLKRTEYGVAYDSKLNPIKDEVTVQWDIAVQDPAAQK
jgi:polyisoprenoid-binding protein YceI